MVYRRWFIEHARGRPFREVSGLPIALTRKMEHIFLGSPPHLPVPAALRRAEILGLRGPQGLVDAVMDTELTRSLHDGAFWRSAIHFFIRYWDELRAERVRSLVATIAALKLRERVVQTPAGPMRVPPPFPDLSLQGRTPRSLDRFIERWRRPATPPAPAGEGWRPSGLAGLEMQDRSRPEGAVRWQIVELLGARELRSEGQRLRHCVGGYVHACVAGRSSIWSLRFARGDEEPRSSYTIEVDPRSRRVVQIRGLRNRRVGGRPAWVIALWAQSQHLAVNVGA